ncbi:hypothetical protein DUI87_18045 [Hirundo rustica rustica]|uniref:Uncharacterized protein n=1 Tax=Hirundo rustica rustica TaxID=333673 RepID=A0A3M0JXI2_HIRRU|nr:hypothetical protein DUI87_18045 [Hirundo rustica rustica]
MVKPMVKQVVPLQPMKDHATVDIHTAAYGGPPATAGGHALNDDDDDHRVPQWSRLLVGTAACGEESTQCRFSGRTCDPMKDPHWSKVLL